MEYVLKTEGLTKRYGNKLAVSNVSMSIKKGDIYGFIGRNGAGKTTTMRMVLGDAIPTSGSIELFGGENPNSARHRIGSLLETPNLYKSCTAFENLKRFSYLTGGTDGEILDALRFVGLVNTDGKKVGQFSLGMKQRLGIAAAMLGKPEFLILDEPVNGLDPAGIRDIRDMILRLNREMGTTILVSSHLLDELAKIVTVYGIINNGELVEEVSAKELQERCSKQLSIAVDDTKKAMSVIYRLTGSSAMSIENGKIILRSELADSGVINKALVENGVTVFELNRKSENLESYFLERTGGKNG